MMKRVSCAVGFFGCCNALMKLHKMEMTKLWLLPMTAFVYIASFMSAHVLSSVDDMRSNSGAKSGGSEMERSERSEENEAS